MSQYKDQFSKYSSEILIKKRALGDELADAAHAAIEEVFRERGEILPARPSQPVLSADISGSPSKTFAGVKTVVVVLVCVVAIGFAKALAHTWVGFAVSALAIAYLLIDRARINAQSPQQKAEESERYLAERDKLNPLMLTAARGDLARTKELVAFGQDVNVKSLAGTSALMYAARNGHLEVVEFLLSNGASPNIKTGSGVSALSLARKFGHSSICDTLIRNGANE